MPIGGDAYAATYVLSDADVGHRISAQVRLAKGNYLERLETLPVGLVRTTPVVEATAKGKLGKAVVNVRITAPGASRRRGRSWSRSRARRSPPGCETARPGSW